MTELYAASSSASPLTALLWCLYPIAVLVVIDEPSKSYAYGSTVAVPVAKEIIESLIVIEKIPPNIKDHGMIVKKP